MSAVQVTEREAFFHVMVGPQASDLIARFRAYENTRLGELPMLLALTALFYRERGRSPASIVELLDEYFRLASLRCAAQLSPGPGLGVPESLRYLPAIAMRSLELPVLDSAMVRKVIHEEVAASAPPHWPALALRGVVDAAVEAVA